MKMRTAAPPSSQPARLSFSIGNNSVPVLVGSQCCGDIVDALRELHMDRLFIVADSKPLALHGESLLAEFSSRGDPPIEILPSIVALESHKTLNVVGRLLDEAVRRGATRRSLIVSFGGGLTANLAGMVAGLLFRGIRVAHLPTTLLAASDGVLSQKQAVNGGGGKNQYGLYVVPSLMGIDLNWLRSLPMSEWSAGLVELLKNALSFDTELLKTFRDFAEAGSRRPIDPLTDGFAMVCAGIRSKERLASIDPFEVNGGAVLEYGHTIGHVLECQLGIGHGAAVGLGMRVAAAVSAGRQWLSAAEVEQHRKLLEMIGTPMNPPRAFAFRELLPLLRCDNKHGRIDCPPGTHPMVLLRRLGSPARTGSIPLVPVLEAEIQNALRSLGWLDGHSYRSRIAPRLATGVPSLERARGDIADRKQ